MLAIDGLQPDVGHEVLWVLRDCLSGEVLLARSLLSACEAELINLLREIQQVVDVPIRGVISDGQHSIRKAMQAVLPDVPHQLCQFHYLCEAAKPVYEADRHAKKELKKHLRGVRPIERAVEHMVVRGPVRIVASVASRLHLFAGPELCPPDLTRWQALRSELNHRHEARCMQYRFRKSPESYLATLEEKLSKERLPP